MTNRNSCIHEPTSDLNLDTSVFYEVMDDTENQEREILRAEKLTNSYLTTQVKKSLLSCKSSNKPQGKDLRDNTLCVPNNKFSLD